KYPGVSVTISYEDSWLDFQRDIVYIDPYYFLTFDKTEALTTLKANGGKVARDLDTLLKKECYAEVVMHSTYFVDESHLQKYMVTKFNRAICAYQLPLAMSLQKYMMQQIEAGKFSADIADKLEIPEVKEYQAFLNNQLCMQYFSKQTMEEETAAKMRQISKLNPTNQVEIYNITLCKVFQTKWKTVAEINALQAEIDKLNQQPTLPKERVTALNLAFQVQILDFLRTEQSTPEFENLRVLTVNKIKQTFSINDSWQNAYKLSKIFVNNYDYMFALNLMEPFINSPAISEDYLFSYISIAAHREETFLSNPFTKAVKTASEKNPARLCGLFDRLPLSIMDNLDVKNIICKTCNK
ncbi:MAG: hypothetical protein LBV46_02445, partial [Bacteroidales bacterium]|nr:hypothetical protein [Bacteroidales bacterium]